MVNNRLYHITDTDLDGNVTFSLSVEATDAEWARIMRSWETAGGWRVTKVTRNSFTMGNGTGRIRDVYREEL